MNMIYNSANYCIVEFPAAENYAAGGFEIVDKQARREIFIEGSLAEKFRQSVAELIATGPTEEDVDEYLSRFDSVMIHPVMLH